jgi:hypothetical protein
VITSNWTHLLEKNTIFSSTALKRSSSTLWIHCIWYDMLQYTMDLIISMQYVPSGTKKLVFEVNVTSAGNDVNPDDNQKKLVLPFGLQADMTITG